MSWFYKPYVPVARRRADAEKKVRALAKKGKKIEPVEIVHRNKIADSFWGRAWCDHLESYSDYANRLPRGRTYARNGSVVHLGIETGRVEAMVSGSSLYKIAIRIDPLPAQKWEVLKRRCQGKIGSLIELLQGKISGEIMAIVTDRGEGLFPGPKEIHMDCDCPDWADLCKHLAAVLYGIGARLDTAPELLFKLRGVDHAELIATGADDLASAGQSGRRRVLAPAALGDVFGIELDETDVSAVAEEPTPARPTKKAAAVETASPASSSRKPSTRRTSRRQKPVKRGDSPAKKPRSSKTAARAKPAVLKNGKPKAGRAAPFRPTAAAIRDLRADLGLSRSAFATAVGVTSATVGNWEKAKGPLRPRPAALAALRRLAKTRG